MFLHKVHDLGQSVLKAHPDDLESFFLEHLLSPLHEGDLLITPLSPACKEVYKDVLPLHLLKVDLITGKDILLCKVKSRKRDRRPSGA
jgi:hypothetical protein